MQKRIDVLTEDAAVELLRNELTDKHDLTTINASQLCQKMQYLPLALQQAIAYIREWSVPVDEYLKAFESYAHELMEACHGDEHYEKTILTTWNMAYQKITEEGDSALAIAMINIMSYLDGNCIKTELFYDYYDKIDYDKYLVQKSLRLLQKYSLITLNTSEDDLQQIIQVHSLLQYVVRMKSDQSYLKQFLNKIFEIPDDKLVYEHSSYGENFYRHLVFMLDKNYFRELVVDKCEKNMNYIRTIFLSKGKVSMLHHILIAVKQFQINTRGFSQQVTLRTEYYIAVCLQ